jgi:hypothetical protein
MRTVLASAALVLTVMATAPAMAAPKCLANNTSFEIGQKECITLSGKSHLARCDMVLNNTSWTKIQDGCSQNDASPETKPASEPGASPAMPSEPTEN